MAEAGGGSAKRRRTASAPPPGIHLADLPDNIFADVASYLPKPSVALFAVAMTAPPERRCLEPSAIGKVILSSHGDWKELDFGCIEQSLAANLTDDDIRNVLTCIADKLQVLKLTGCTNINGCGLEPLRGSLILKQIDLECGGGPQSMISESTVLPVLNSILDAEGNSFRHYRTPRKWRDEETSSLEAFLQKYDALIRNRNTKCCQCSEIITTPFYCDNEGDGTHGKDYCGDCVKAEKQRIKQKSLEFVRQMASEMAFTIVTADSATNADLECRDAGIEEYRHYSV
ncbi:hypothetical protein ACHAXT_007599 [Thalassiosira profunda]